jgi:hypothetical protein
MIETLTSILYDQMFGPLFWFFGQYGGLILAWFPLWGPFVFGAFFYYMWLSYVRQYNIFDEDHVLLEVTLPQEQNKAPDAMELALHALHQTSVPGKFIGTYWEGNVQAWFSLELVSIEGDIHLFIWTPEFFRDIVEHNIYSQYPEVEVTEVPDYTDFIKFDTDVFELWGSEFELTDDDAKPIKTYIDYDFTGGIDEDEQVDPMTPIIEFLGSARRGEQIWIQILVRGHDGKPDGLFGETDWEDEAEELANDLMKRDSDSRRPESALDDNGGGPGPELSNFEEDRVEAIQRNASKIGFDCGIRGLYIAESDQFRTVNIPGMIGTFKQFDAKGRNGFKPTRGMTKFDFPWEDYKEYRQNKERRRLFEAYRLRSYFHPPYKRPHFVLSAEELATIFHFPGQVSQTPTFRRIESKKAQPPTDLPTE